MKLIQKKPMTAFKTYSSVLVFLIVIVFTKNLTAQEKTYWQEIELTDTLDYTRFAVSNVFNDKYSPVNLFDTKLNTCWVLGADKNPNLPSLFVKLPEQNNIVINIFSGYGKSEKLYFQNSRPKKNPVERICRY